MVIINAFVGGMIGLERTIFPKYAEEGFGISSNTALLSFIAAFGISKAITNYLTGSLANKVGRRNLLLAGWVIALPIPFILIWAPSWTWVVISNVLLGISQGLAWSSTVVMKIDLVGDKHRGLAMGINEFAGYFAVGITACFSGHIASRYGVTPYPFYVGIGLSLAGLLSTLFWVKDTRSHVLQETKTDTTPLLENVFIDTSFRNKKLSTVTQAGMVNNLNDGMIWGLLPVLLFGLSDNPQTAGIITSIYPAVWGIGQLFTGRMSDIYSKKRLLFWGMFLQGIAIFFIPYSNIMALGIIAVVLGWGTAMVYPTFLSAVAAATHPSQRAESLGTFRLWRDLGYAAGAILSGIIADILGIQYAILTIGAITITSSLVIQFRMPADK